jgi:hypothetical protein
VAISSRSGAFAGYVALVVPPLTERGALGGEVVLVLEVRLGDGGTPSS